MMEIKSVEFIGSFPNFSKTPVFEKPEYAFIGRSNTGKSSLINYICDKKSLALVSSKPGKTRMLNYFLVNDSWYLIDLPGYGYAKVAKKLRDSWIKLMKEFLDKRQNLLCTFVLIDANISPQKIDLEFINWMGSKGIPFVIVYTKTDKSKPLAISRNIQSFRQKLSEQWASLPVEIKTSAHQKIGEKDLLGLISSTTENYLKQNHG